MKVALTLAALLAVILLVDGSPIPGLAGLPDLPGMGHGFGAKISNIIKGNTYDGLERAMKKLSSRRSHRSSSESNESDADGSAMFGLSGKQFEQLISMLQQSKQGAPEQQPNPIGAVPFAAIDNKVSSEVSSDVSSDVSSEVSSDVSSEVPSELEESRHTLTLTSRSSSSSSAITFTSSTLISLLMSISASTSTFTISPMLLLLIDIGPPRAATADTASKTLTSRNFMVTFGKRRDLAITQGHCKSFYTNFNIDTGAELALQGDK
uniref:Uncharacterized protein n=1 Tax=Anopheles farauti TaxID=69004 RepID=A0A182QZC3_9DIPT